MTDIMKLADDYARAYMSFGETASRAALQSAIEALQAENERLLREVVNRNQRALDGDKAMKVLDTTVTELEALQAKLEELQRQEPVAHQFQTEIDKKWHNFIDDEHYHHTVDDGRWPIRALYAAPKALAPLTQQRIQEIHEQVMREPIRTSGFFESFTRAVEAAHGITKGTP